MHKTTNGAGYTIGYGMPPQSTQFRLLLGMMSLTSLSRAAPSLSGAERTGDRSSTCHPASSSRFLYPFVGLLICSGLIREYA